MEYFKNINLYKCFAGYCNIINDNIQTMEVSPTFVKALSKEECVNMLTEVNKELHNYNRTSPEQLQNIVNLCAMVRKQLDYLRLKEKDNGRFISKVIREKIDALDIKARKDLANNLTGELDFESRCIIDYINQINYEQEHP